VADDLEHGGGDVASSKKKAMQQIIAAEARRELYSIAACYQLRWDLSRRINSIL
jgi:hypothetical protein